MRRGRQDSGLLGGDSSFPPPPCANETQEGHEDGLTMMRHMDCDEIRRLLVPFADGELEPGLREAVEEHLRSCATCRQEHEQLVAALEAFLVLGRNAAPRPPRNTLAEEIVRKAVARPRRLAASRRLLPVAAAAVLLLGVTLGLVQVWRLAARSRSHTVTSPVANEHLKPTSPNDNSADARIAQGLFEARLDCREGSIRRGSECAGHGRSPMFA